MACFRVNKDRDYTTMSNYHLKDMNLSLKAIGLLSKMLSLPDDWDYSINGLVAICKDKKTSVISALDELKEHGYVIVTKKMPSETDTGRIEYIYDIYERPQSEKQGIEKQGIENLGLEFLGLENQPQLNTNKSNTKELSTKELNRYSSSGKREVYDEVIGFLNWKCGTNYKSCSRKTRSLIDARLNDGFKLEDFKTVITKKSADWLGDERMRKYLRPETLFGTKFESYLNQPYNRNQDKSFYERLSEITNRMEKGQL